MLFSIFCFIFFTALPMLQAATYPDSKDEISPTYHGPLFVLSQNFPRELPRTERNWEEIDFQNEMERYLLVLRDYAYEGMIEADWKCENNTIRKWFHMPWMHQGKHPRECLRGLTRERDTPRCRLGKQQKRDLQNWGLSLFNDYAAYTIGQVWENSEVPDPKKCTFPVGAVAVKLLFTDATVQEIPELEGTIVWQANINEGIDILSPKVISDVRLLQMDIAVRDARSPAGWVFATYVYDKTRQGQSAWEKMAPVGLTWGNDAQLSCEEIENGAPLTETLIHPAAPLFAKRRLGCGGRLNGPVDNPKSCCLSCHSTAQWEPISKMTPRGTALEKSRWFRNLPHGEAFDKGQISLDYSLQMQIALKNFYDHSEPRSENGK